jgi:hypothetical protein
MQNIGFALEAAWKVLLAGLIFGAGLPALFAVGIRSLAAASGGDAQAHGPGASPRPHPAGRLIACVCFTLVLAAVALGIAFIVATGLGKALSFEHVYPTLTGRH